VALISGQGPTPATAANCPEYKDVSPGTLNAEGQAEGDGCVYPAEVKALPGQLILRAAGDRIRRRRWRPALRSRRVQPQLLVACSLQ